MSTLSNTTFIFSVRRTFLFLVLILQLVACPLWGQVVQKKALEVSYYDRWGELTLKKMAPNGQWLSYTMSYENGLDTLFVKNTKSPTKYFFPIANNGEFIDNHWFICKTKKELQVLNLKNGKQQVLSNVLQYSYNAKKKVFTVLQNQNNQNSLLIQTFEGIVKEQISDVAEFTADPTNQMLLYTVKTKTENSINLLDLNHDNQTTVLTKGMGEFSNLVWNKTGKTACAFLQKSSGASEEQNSIFYYNTVSKKLYKSNLVNQNLQIGDSLYVTETSYKLQISDDAKRVFFILHKKNNQKQNSDIADLQLWNGNAKWIYPMEQKQKLFLGNYLAQWSVLEDKYLLISNDSLPQFMLNGDQRYAILFNTKKYEPQYTRDGISDFYITDLLSGKTKLFLEKHSASSFYTIPSPAGNYISYFKGQNWWMYDIKKEKHINVTKNIGSTFFQNKKEHPGNEDPYMQLGWTVDDKEILLYDTYDVWAINSNVGTSRRLTKGKETQTQYRQANYGRILSGRPNYNGWIIDAVNLKNGMLLGVTNDSIISGYYWLSDNENKKLIFSDSSRLDQLLYSETSKISAYREQRYDLSPRIMSKQNDVKSPDLLLQTNAHQKDFFWGRSKLITYQNKKGKSLKSILYYPAQYSKEKKYPMIVYIYEKLSDYLHHYINPSQYTGDGSFNITTFTTQGYFVLAPDISYEIGDPGISATDCVVSAANKVIEMGLVDQNKLGLVGHSFGGYETHFIITQTNLFAAAVAGSSITDLTSFYLSAGTSSGKPEVWRLENQQWRMGKSLFEDRASYKRNSPVEHAQNISTPLLTWTGGSDRQIHWHQSLEFYLALHRLKKQHIMAVYTKEDHTLSESANQKDLSVRLHQWFDYYLKDAQPAQWIKEGIN